MPTLRPLRNALAIGKETAWGTPVVPTRFYPTPDGGTDLKIATERGYVASVTEGFALESGYVPGVPRVEGGATVVLDYEKIGMLLEFLMGKAETVTVVTGSFQHDWDTDPNMSAVEGKGLTAEIALSDPPGAGLGAFMRYTGLKITEAAFHVEVGGGMTLELTLIGKSGAFTSATDPTAYVFSTAPKIVANNLGTNALFQVNAVTYPIRNFDLTVRNGLAAFDPTITDTGISEPLRAESFEITWEAMAEAPDAALLTDMTGGTARAVVFDLQGPIASGTIRYEIKFNMPKSSIDAGADPRVDRLGEPALLHLEGRALKPSSGTPPNDLRITLVNNQATEV
jgi:hypothetical protein